MRPTAKRVLAAVLAAVLLSAGPALDWGLTDALSGGRTLSVPTVRQSQPLWCWAAATQSIVRYLFGFTYSQCTQANHNFRRGDCCTNPASSYCNKASSLVSVQDYLANNKNIITDWTFSQLTWANVSNEIGTQGRPFWVRWGWGGSLTNGHIVAVHGYWWHDSGDKSIGTMDPSDGTFKWYDWPWFRSNSTFTWTDSMWKAWRI